MTDQESSDNSTRLVSPGATQSALQPGTLLLHTYRVERLLARGGMGDIYLARHTELDTQHAIKVIKSDLMSDPSMLALFRREASILREIHDDGVVGYEGFFRDETGRYYLVTEYVKGPSLAQILEERTLSVAEFYVLRDRLCRGLVAAHAKGVIHRDLAPDNVILPDGRIDNAKLIDFGIAKLTQADASTIIGESFAGKYRYASPEQLHVSEHPVDATSDIYSLALVLAAAARGNPLDMGRSLMDACQARRTVPDLSGVPAELQEQLKAMLQPNPSARPQNLNELLRRWPAAGPSSPLPPRRRYGPLVLAAAAALLLAAGAFWLRDWFIKSAGDSAKTPVMESARQVEAPAEICSGDIFQLPLPEITARIGSLPAAEIGQCGDRFYQRKRLDEALLLWEEAARQQHGPAALKIGELYDPIYWGKISSPFSKPNPMQAEKWYQRAAALGVAEADAHLAALADWRRDHQDAQQ